MTKSDPSTPSIRVYSRTIIDDDGTLSRYEYNGSFAYDADLEMMTPEEMEGYARAFDCFFQVLFVRDCDCALSYVMAAYR